MSHTEEQISKIPVPKNLKELIDMGFEALEECVSNGYSFYYNEVLDTKKKTVCLMGAILLKYNVELDNLWVQLHTNAFFDSKIGNILWTLSDICGQNYTTACKRLAISTDERMLTEFCTKLHGYDFSGFSSCLEDGPNNIEEYVDYNYDEPDECEEYPDKNRFYEFMKIVGNVEFN